MSNFQSDAYLISFYASFFAVTAMETPAILVGIPPMYRPINTAPYNWSRFMHFYQFFEGHLKAILQQDNLSFYSGQ